MGISHFLNKCDSNDPHNRRLRRTIINTTERTAKQEHCGQPVNAARSPVVVPPTWSKMGGYREISAVWRAAAEELASAEKIVVIGYSLPPTDMFFQYLFALGTATDVPLSEFLVVDPSPAIKERFLPFLGEGAKAEFDFIQKKFEDEDTAKILRQKLLGE